MRKRIVLSTLQMLMWAAAIAQVGAQTKPPMAEEVFKNVQVLKGIPADEFMNTMGFFAASLSFNCTTCHGTESAGDVARFANDTPLKQTARKMILIVRSINQANFAGTRKVTCYTCHRGGEKPEVTPSLEQQYSTPLPDDPDQFEATQDGGERVSADEVFDKYIQALGGAQQLAQMASFTAKGTYEGYDTDREPVPVEVFAKVPDRRSTVIHLPDGNKIMTYDGRDAWIAEPSTPLPLTQLSGGDLDGAKIDGLMAFAVGVKESRSRWEVGTTTIDERQVRVLEGFGSGQTPIKLYFDKDSGLLVRQVRYANTAVGLVPTQVDYTDYRALSGVKMPFKWTVTWVDGQSTTELSVLTPNVPIDASQFAKPAPPTTPTK